MRAALSRHDDILREAISAHDGWLFKHTGDGVVAAFGSASAALAAAALAQGALRLPVRMGIATGETSERDDDYFGPVLNRAARIMAAGHGGQVLVAASTASLVDGAGLVDLGEYRLRDLSGATRLFQLRVDGLDTTFPPLRTLDAVPGNLPSQRTSFIGRELELKELCTLVRSGRLITVTGVGGVGKTRLALQAGAELSGEFPDGVWLVELAPLSDPASVIEAVANSLGVVDRAGSTLLDSMARALSGRRLLIVLDNCEHVLDATADLVEMVLTRTSTVKVLATSREGLRVADEQLWPAPSLSVDAGAVSPAVALFVERARAVNPAFGLQSEADVATVTEICRRLDGIALAIELAAARMVSMSPADVLERLKNRFRLLSGARRGLERHQTLRHAVQWSYELLTTEEQDLLGCSSVFADGFSLDSITRVWDRFDEFTVLDLLDSLVRKSLVTLQRAEGHTRYGLLETIRQFSEEQHADAGLRALRDRHAEYFAARAISYWNTWNGPEQRLSQDWVEAEFANLRAAFRWAAAREDLSCAATIAAHSTMLTATDLQRYEPVGWVEEILEPATAADLSQLPRLYIAASFCGFIGRPDTAIAYAHTAARLQGDLRYDAFEHEWSGLMEGNAHGYAGRNERYVQIYTDLAARPGPLRVAAQCGLLTMLPAVGQAKLAAAMAEDTLSAARAHGNPSWIAFAMWGYGRAFEKTDPQRALDALRTGLAYTREHRLLNFEAFIARDAAGLEAVHGDLEDALALYDSTLAAFHRAGNVTITTLTLAELAVLFARIDRAEIAATLHGASNHLSATKRSEKLRAAVDRVRAVLGEAVFHQQVAVGAAMDHTSAVNYARAQISHTAGQLGPIRASTCDRVDEP